jgi:gamma-glutamyltranspeptidase / glutathione hydrolase
VVVDVIDRGMDIASAESAPRIHNQWLPDQVFAEPGVSPDLIAALQARGDKVVPTGKFTSVNSIVVMPDGFIGAADPRTHGGLAVGF